MIIYDAIRQAEQRIRPYIRETPLDYSPALSQSSGANVYVKLENLQYTGSFKARGALNKLLALTPEQRARGIATASSGNHGAAVAFGLRALDMSGLIFVPENVSAAKVANIQRLGGEVRFFGHDSGLTELHARRYAETHGLTYVSPYNDEQVIAGQGTIGAELARQLPELDAVVVAVGGGGLISGIAGFLKAHSPRPLRVIGCQPRNSAVMYESIKAGEVVERESLPTLSDGTAGGIEPGAITFALCRDLVDEYVLVSEDEIAASMRQFMETHHQLIEGAAGTALAGLAQLREQLREQNVAIIICGANISLAALKSIL